MTVAMALDGTRFSSNAPARFSVPPESPRRPIRRHPPGAALLAPKPVLILSHDGLCRARDGSALRADARRVQRFGQPTSAPELLSSHASGQG